MNTSKPINASTKTGRLVMLASALAIAAALLTAPGALADHKGTPHGKPGGDGGGDGDSGGVAAFGRADFVATPGFNIVDDGQASCFTGDHPLDGVWDYWDLRDTTDCPLEDESLYVRQSDFNSVGHWIFNTGFHPTNDWQRYLVFHWQPIGNSPKDPKLDDKLSPDIADDTFGVDNLRVFISADLFKGFDRQPLDIDLWRSIEGEIGRPYVLRYKEPLYIVRDPNDPDIAVLTTEGDPDLGQPNVREAELINDEAKGKNNPDRIVGTYEMPMTIVVRWVAATQ